MKWGFSEYCVAYCASEIKNILNLNENQYRVIKNNWNSWSADPFLFKYNDDIYIFAEVWKYSERKGAIGYCKWDRVKKTFSKWKIVISENYHLSYPNIFIWNNQIMLCPESGECEKIYLYKAVSFPNEWEKYMVLLSEGKFVDTTFWSFSDKGGGISCELKEQKEILRFFKIINGKIVLERENAIVQRENRMRPGGKFIQTGNRIYRIAQLGEPYYGKGIILNEVDISCGKYHEKEVKEFTVEDFNLIGIRGKRKGVHTFNRCGNFSVIDIRCERVRILPRILRLSGTLKEFVLKKIRSISIFKG